MRIVAMALAALATACSGTGETPSARDGLYESVAAPTAVDIAVRITEAQAGERVSVPVGARFAVELVGVPTAGYVWDVESVPDFLTEGGTLGGPTTRAQMEPGFAGGNHWEVLTFTAVRAGAGVLQFEMRRAWESDEPAARTFEVTIEAQ